MNSAIRSYLHFTDEDLKANREGQISRSQFQRRKKQNKVILYLLSPVILLFSLGFLTTVDTIGLSEYLFTAFLFLLMLGLLLLFIYRQNVALDKGIVASATGTIQYRIFRGSKSLIIGEPAVSLPWPAPADFLEGSTRYIIYYIKGSHDTLSIEVADSLLAKGSK